MNERIKELSVETDVWCDQNWYGHEFYDVRWEEKFAELIVRECIGLLPEDCQSKNGCHTSWIMKEHFGVEE